MSSGGSAVRRIWSVCVLSVRGKASSSGARAVYACGLAAAGGLISNARLNAAALAGSSHFELRRPKRVTYCESKSIRHVAAGFGFSVFASAEKVFGGGVNIFSNDVHSVNRWANGRRVMCGEFPEAILGVAAGRRHFLVATRGAVYAFGDNAHGQCGEDPRQRPFVVPNQKTGLRPVPVPSDAKVAHVHCTLDTSFVVMESGEVFSFGLGTDGQLGRGLAPFDFRCLPVEGSLKGVQVVSLKGSTDTLMAVSREGDLFMWGQNEYAQMAPFVEDMQVGTPCEVRFSFGKVREAVSTATSCAALTSDGRVFVWGFGVLGLGPSTASLLRPTQLDAALFSGGPGDCGDVSRLFAGNTSMFAISKTDHLFAWGVNRFSHLGLGNDKDQFFPFQVSIPKQPCDLSVSPDHTLLLLR